VHGLAREEHRTAGAKAVQQPAAAAERLRGRGRAGRSTCAVSEPARAAKTFSAAKCERAAAAAAPRCRPRGAGGATSAPADALPPAGSVRRRGRGGGAPCAAAWRRAAQTTARNVGARLACGRHAAAPEHTRWRRRRRGTRLARAAPRAPPSMPAAAGPTARAARQLVARWRERKAGRRRRQAARSTRTTRGRLPLRTTLQPRLAFVAPRRRRLARTRRLLQQCASLSSCVKGRRPAARRRQCRSAVGTLAAQRGGRAGCRAPRRAGATQQGAAALRRPRLRRAGERRRRARAELGTTRLQVAGLEPLQEILPRHSSSTNGAPLGPALAAGDQATASLRQRARLD
jgi:hypothetical protein